MDLGDEREWKIRGVEDMEDVIMLVRRLREDVLEGLKCRVDYGSSRVVMQEGVAAITDWGWEGGDLVMVVSNRTRTAR